MKSVAYALEPGTSERAARNVVVAYVLALVALPLVALFAFGVSDGLTALGDVLRSPVARAALWLTLWTGLLVGALNVLFGVATAWVLVRYDFPGKAVISALVDLPLAIPTLVAGMMLAILYGHDSLLGQRLSVAGVQVIFAQPGIVLALSFVTLPFVIRAVEPVLLEIDPAEEEAATMLGAGAWRTFRTVFMPALAPVAISSGIRSVGRALGEFGSIVVVAGNLPFRTLTAPVYVFGEIESGAPRAAAAASVLLLGVAIALHLIAGVIEKRVGARHA